MIIEQGADGMGSTAASEAITVLKGPHIGAALNAAIAECTTEMLALQSGGTPAAAAPRRPVHTPLAGALSHAFDLHRRVPGHAFSTRAGPGPISTTSSVRWTTP